jgi:hypothetical protein
MTISTVGDIIKALSQFDPNLPIVGSCGGDAQYFDIHIVEKMVYRIRALSNADGYVDTSERDPRGFDAVVL